jgi:NDP-sugar pyrophosphorylase family protein
MTQQKKKKVQALILAGGKGTRLRPLTLATPKPVVPLANRPFLVYQLDMLRRAGIRDAVLSLSYRPADVRRIMKDSCPRGVSLDFVVEDEPLGTGGAVRYAARGRRGTLVVLNGDILIDIDLRAVLERHRRSGALATIVLTRVKDPTVYGLVETDSEGLVRGFLEKPSWEEVTCDTINAGIYVIEEELLRYLPPRPCSIEREFFPELVRQGEPFYAFTHEGYWLDIGTSVKYLQAHRDLLGGLVRSFPGYRRKGTGLWSAPGVKTGFRFTRHGEAMLGPRTAIGRDVRFTGTVVLGPNAKIGDNVSLDDCVLWDGVEIGEGAKLRGCILGDGVRIGAHAHLAGHVVLGEQAVIPEYSHMSGGSGGNTA